MPSRPGLFSSSFAVAEFARIPRLVAEFVRIPTMRLRTFYAFRCYALQSAIRNPQSPISNPQSPISNPQSPISNPQSPISNPQSAISSPRRAFTLVELLVVIAIIGILTGLLLPAVQYAREAGRRTQCQNNLKQLGLAAIMHHDTHKHFPTGGWGYRWVGDSSRGFGEAQPGGWIFNILPYLEQENLRSQGTDATRAQMLGVPLEVLICPSRRRAGLYPYGETMVGLANCAAPASAAKSDYAICAGDEPQPGGAGPADLTDTTYQWPSFSKATGISFVRTRIGLEQVKDGASNTVMIGEKHLPYAEYDSGISLGDDQTMLLGDDADIRRWMSGPPLADSTPGEPDRFGGPHAGGAYFVFCDGGVRMISRDLNGQVCKNIGNRRDGNQPMVLP